MSRIVNKDRSILLQRFVSAIGSAREPFIETGRKFDKVYVEGKVRYFVARMDMTVTPTNGVETVQVHEGDIYGAKSKLAPNFRWFFGTLAHADKWDWSDHHGKPVDDKSVLPVKGYGRYTHYKRIEA
jgi:hypothetical protein